jgi:uncharacterized protein YhhL (DUF1145 family)
MNAPKSALLVVWLLCASSFVIATDSTFATWARYVFFLMLAAHLVEFGLFFSKLRQAPGSLATHFFNTLVFGFLHLQALPPAEEEGGV